MTTTITERDKKLLYFCGIVVFLFLFFRLFFLPGLEAMQQAEADLQTAEEARTELQLTAAMAPAAARQVLETGDELRSAAAGFYPLLKSNALDTLVTGIELDHNLLPLSLTIGQPAPAYASAGQAGLVPGTDNLVLAPLDPGAPDTALDSDWLQAVTVSFRAQGSRSDFAALLDDLAANYPAIELRSFFISDSASVDQAGATDVVSRFDCTLVIYLCDKERELN